MLWSVTYTDPRSLTGKGSAIVTTEGLARIATTYSNVEFRVYRSEDESILTPAAVAACMGNSPSL